MIAYISRGLPIEVSRIITTFRAFGGLNRWSCVFFVPFDLMGALLGCCFIVFVDFRFTSRSVHLSLIDLIIKFFRVYKDT